MRKSGSSYFLATFIVWVLAIQLLPFPRGAAGVEAWISAAVNLAAAVMGIILCYMVNKRGDNSDFIARMICLGWPIGIWFMVGLSTGLLCLVLLGSLPSQPRGPEAFQFAMANNLRRIWEYFFVNPWLGTLIIWPYYLIISDQLISIAKRERAASPIQGETKWEPAKILLAIYGGVAIAVTVMSVMIGGLVWFEGSILSKFATFLPLAVVLLFYTGRVLVRLWRSSQKRA